MTKLRIVAGPYEFEAEAEEQAPTTLARFVALLPYRQQNIHFPWGGGGVGLPPGAWPYHPSSGRNQRDRDPSGLWRRLLRQQGRTTRRQPFSHHHQRPREPHRARQA